MKRKISENITEKKESILLYINKPNEADQRSKKFAKPLDDKSNIQLQKEVKLNILEDNEDLEKRFPLYIVNNFEKVLSEIFDNSNDISLFSDIELDILSIFKNLSNGPKTLFLKLFGRQWKWQRIDKEVSIYSPASIKSLLDSNLITDEIDDLTIESKLDLLLVNEVENIAKKFNIKSSIKKKNILIDLIMKSVNNKNEITKFFVVKSSTSLLNKLEIELKNYLKSTFKITKVVRDTFCKITLLFSIATSNWDDCSHLGERNRNELYFLLKLDRGEISLPTYKLSRVSNIFQNGVHLDNYVQAMEYSLKLGHYLDNNKFDEAYNVYLIVSSQFTPDFLTKDVNNFDQHLTGFMGKFSLKTLLIHIYSMSVTVMEKRKRYYDAVDLLKYLIGVTVSKSISKSRGKWYLRLCVNYKSHLKDDVQSKYWLEEALRDESIPEHFRLTFKERLGKFKKRGDKNTSMEELDDSTDVLVELVEIEDQIKTIRTIEAPRFVENLQTRPSYKWVQADKIIHCYVEDYVILHFTNGNEFTHGIHGETRTFVMYFLLLFYDVIYADVPDAFYSYRQTIPLDMHSSTFRSSRALLIGEKIDWLQSLTEVDVADILNDNWISHVDETCLVGDWSVIGGLDNLLGLFYCLGTDLILKICEKFLDNFHYWSSGMPDLVLWNTDLRTYEIVEVKGPGDKLSDKQKLWIRELQQMGANVSLCMVEGTCCKKL